MLKDTIVESYRIKGETFTVTGDAIDSGTYKTVYKMTSATGKAMVLKIEKPQGDNYSQSSWTFLY